MATISKRRARSLAAVGPMSIGYANHPSSMLTTNKHVTIGIGDYTVRIEMASAQNLANEILAICQAHRDEKS